MLGKDIGLTEVAMLYVALVGKFGYGSMVKVDVSWWVKDTWGDFLGYSLDIYIPTNGWYCFKFRREHDVDCIFQECGCVVKAT